MKYKGLLYLAMIVVAVPLLAYRYALSDTVGQWLGTGKYRQQTERLRTSGSGHGKPQTVEISDTEMILSGLLVAELLPEIESEKLRIEQYYPCVTSDKDGIMLTTGRISVQGGFTGIVKLLDRLERETPCCKVVSAEFRSVRPRSRGGIKTLGCTIYVQQIMTND